MRRLLVTAALVPAVSVPAACGAGANDSTGSVTVFAAASLTDAFAQVAEAFEEAGSEASVELSFAGSSSLREQILAGAPADVFASADPSNMDAVLAEGAVSEVVTFATNRLQVAVPAGNPADVDGLEDFADPDLLIGLCAEEVPCGAFAREALGSAGVDPSPDTNEPDVRALLTKIEAGELDAGIVYATDVVSAGSGVEGIGIPEVHNVVASYRIGVSVESDDPEVASAFVRFVLGPTGQAVLSEHGFGGPRAEP